MLMCMFFFWYRLVFILSWTCCLFLFIYTELWSSVIIWKFLSAIVLINLLLLGCPLWNSFYFSKFPAPVLRSTKTKKKLTIIEFFFLPIALLSCLLIIMCSWVGSRSVNVTLDYWENNNPGLEPFCSRMSEAACKRWAMVSWPSIHSGSNNIPEGNAIWTSHPGEVRTNAARFYIWINVKKKKKWGQYSVTAKVYTYK